MPLPVRVLPKALLSAAILLLGALGGALVLAAPASAAGPDLAVDAAVAPSPTDPKASRVTVDVSNVGSAASGGVTVTATNNNPAAQYSLVGHPGWTCAQLPLTGACTHAGLAPAGTAAPLRVDIVAFDGPIVFVITVASPGDADTGNNSKTVTVPPRVMRVTGRVWSDDNGNGRQDAGEAGLGDVPVRAVIPGTTTVVANDWTFGDTYTLLIPDPGTAVEIVVDPANTLGRQPGPRDVGPGDALDSDVGPGRKVTVPYAVGTTVDIDAGLLPKGVPPANPPAPQAGGGGLPVTGPSLVPLLALAFLLVSAGAVLRRAATRR